MGKIRLFFGADKISVILTGSKSYRIGQICKVRMSDKDTILQFERREQLEDELPKDCKRLEEYVYINHIITRNFCLTEYTD